MNMWSFFSLDLAPAAQKVKLRIKLTHKVTIKQRRQPLGLGFNKRNKKEGARHTVESGPCIDSFGSNKLVTCFV